MAPRILPTVYVGQPFERTAVLKQGGVVGGIYAVYTSNKKRMWMLLDPIRPVDGAWWRKEQPALVAQQKGDEGRGNMVDLSLANVAQTSAPKNSVLI